jgi:RNA polymerase sigma factor (sigma-70 family)
MPINIEAFERCKAMVSALSVEGGWKLDADQQEAYVTAIVSLMPEPCSDVTLRVLVQNYHKDHDLVQSLRDRHHPDHSKAWQSWITQTIKIIQHQKQIRSESALISVEDLAQYAVEELLRVLPTYRYRSRFSTWAYTVIVRSRKRYLVRLHAAKRGGTTQDSYGLDVPVQHVTVDVQFPEQLAADHALVELIETVLTTEEDRRLALIFRLWVIDDMRLTDIGKCVNLDASRISVLLDRARQLLHQHPEIRAWFGKAPLDPEQ